MKSTFHEYFQASNLSYLPALTLYSKNGILTKNTLFRFKLGTITRSTPNNYQTTLTYNVTI